MKKTVLALGAVFVGACGAFQGGGEGAPAAGSDAGVYQAPRDAGSSADASGSFGNVGVGGGQDFAAFRHALDQGLIPSADSIDATGFFAEHYTALPAPTCGQRFCLHGMLSVTPNLVHNGTTTLLQLAMNSPIDPQTVPKPPLELVVVVDRSGSMASADKLTYAKQGLKLLVDELGPADSLTLIAFDDSVDRLYGPAAVVDRAAIKGIIDELEPRGSTNIYAALEQAYEEVLHSSDSHQRRVIFLTDGLPTVGTTNGDAIARMSAGYNERHVQLTTIGVGLDAGLPLMRRLAEQGGGNFYFLENPKAATEVFTEELRFFVAPIAYDLDLSFDTGRAYGVGGLYGTSLWQRTATGGKVHIPSVFLVSRTSTEPGGPDGTGGRRGGGSAIIAELKPDALGDGPGHRVSTAHLRYRLPGATNFESQDVEIFYGDRPGQCSAGGYASHVEIDKNAVIMSFFVALREATVLASSNRSAARTLLTGFRERIALRLADVTDEDLQDDLSILDQFILVLGR